MYEVKIKNNNNNFKKLSRPIALLVLLTPANHILKKNCMFYRLPKKNNIRKKLASKKTSYVFLYLEIFTPGSGGGGNWLVVIFMGKIGMEGEKQRGQKQRKRGKKKGKLKLKR